MFPQLSEFIKLGKKTPKMVNIRVSKMNEIARLHSLGTVDKESLTEWIEEMDAGKWHNRFHMIWLTNRFHVVVRLFSNRSQMTSKCCKNKKLPCH